MPYWAFENHTRLPSMRNVSSHNLGLLARSNPNASLLVIEDTIKLDTQRLIEKALHGKVKLMITSCCIRVLYEKNKKGARDAQLAAAIERAKSYERLRCGHLMDQDPLSPHECLMSVMNYKGKGNKHRYCLATQNDDSTWHPWYRMGGNLIR
jgi:rRNA-processing protein FCF1